MVSHTGDGEAATSRPQLPLEAEDDERRGLREWKRRDELRRGSRSRPIVPKHRRKPKHRKEVVEE